MRRIIGFISLAIMVALLLATGAYADEAEKGYLPSELLRDAYVLWKGPSWGDYTLESDGQRMLSLWNLHEGLRSLDNALNINGQQLYLPGPRPALWLVPGVYTKPFNEHKLVLNGRAHFNGIHITANATWWPEKLAATLGHELGHWIWMEALTDTDRRAYGMLLPPGTDQKSIEECFAEDSRKYIFSQPDFPSHSLTSWPERDTATHMHFLWESLAVKG